MSYESDLRYLPICEPCIRGEGDECHTPGCALWMRDVPPDGLVDLPSGDLVAERDAALAKVEQVAAAITDTTLDGHTPRLHKHSTTETGWLSTACECGFAWPCPHVLAAQVEAVKAILDGGADE